jgi:hypothetical protein
MTVADFRLCWTCRSGQKEPHEEELPWTTRAKNQITDLLVDRAIHPAI